MVKSSAGIQDIVLNQARKENMIVTIILTKGFQIKGTILGFDNYVIVLESEGKQQMIYKHAVSTIIPARSVKLKLQEEE